MAGTFYVTTLPCIWSVHPTGLTKPMHCEDVIKMNSVQTFIQIFVLLLPIVLVYCASSLRIQQQFLHRFLFFTKQLVYFFFLSAVLSRLCWQHWAPGIIISLVLTTATVWFTFAAGHNLLTYTFDVEAQ